MKISLTAIGLATILLMIPGCSVNSRNQMIKSGQHPLGAESLYNLVSGKNLHLTAIDFDAQVYFKDNQKLAARNRAGETDTGNWDVTTDNMLCLDFDKWYYGDLRCYSVFAEPQEDSYIFFTNNGARYYTAKPLDTVPAKLISLGTGKKRTSYIKERQSIPETTAPRPAVPEMEPAREVAAPEPSPEEMKRLMIITARNCPACDLSGVDLSNGELVGANLSGANLAGADLRGANLRRADLSGANLAGANLRAANLPGALLRRCDLTRADFSGANLIKADLTGSTTQDAIFNNALLEGTTGRK